MRMHSDEFFPYYIINFIISFRFFHPIEPVENHNFLVKAPTVLSIPSRPINKGTLFSAQ
jgi:hypothetical protein